MEANLKQLEKIKKILFTDAQIESGNLEIPSRESLLSIDPNDLTVRQSNILRLHDTGINIDGAQIKTEFGAMLQEAFPFQKDTKGMAHKSSPSVIAVNKLNGIVNKLKKTGFTQGFETPLSILTKEVQTKGFNSLGISPSQARDFRYVLNRTVNQLELSGKETTFLRSLQKNLEKSQSTKSKPDKLFAYPTAEQFYTRHAKIIRNIEVDLRGTEKKPKKPSAKEIFKADSQKAAVYLWGFTGERLVQFTSTLLYVPTAWQDKGGLEGFLEYAKGTGREPGYIDASNPVAIIPINPFPGQAKGYTPIPLIPPLQAFMKDRIRKSLGGLKAGYIKDPSGAGAIPLFPGVETGPQLNTALNRGQYKEVFADLEKSTYAQDGTELPGMGRPIEAKDNRKILPSMMLTQAGMSPVQSAQVIESMHGKQKETLAFAEGILDKVSRESYVGARVIGEKLTNETVGQAFLLRQQAKALGVQTLNEIPARLGLGLIPELTDEGVTRFSIDLAEDTDPDVPETTKTVSKTDNETFVKSAELSEAETEEAITASELRSEKNKLETERVKQERIAQFGEEPTTSARTSSDPRTVVQQTDELIDQPKPVVQKFAFGEALRIGAITPEEVKMAEQAKANGDMDTYNEVRRDSFSKIRQILKDNIKKGIKTALPIMAGGALGAVSIAAEVAAEAADASPIGTPPEDVPPEELLKSLQTGMAGRTGRGERFTNVPKIEKEVESRIATETAVRSEDAAQNAALERLRAMGTIGRKPKDLLPKNVEGQLGFIEQQRKDMVNRPSMLQQEYEGYLNQQRRK
tara:strand:- start:9324 stop:11729 length:2406 start_codon:yes stop_codon:yes gene_type:complete